VNVFAIGKSLFVMALLFGGAARADNLPSPNLCPHTANRYLYQDNAAATNAATKELLRSSLVTASQLIVDRRTQGFVFLDDLGNTWVTVAPNAEARVKAYFHDLPPPNLMLLSAFQSAPNHPLPPWAHLEKCPPP
jgi:hypothetical protein